jgi:hypothetical protein
MQNGQMSANEALLSISADISCRPVSTEGARNRFEQPLQATVF